MAKVVIIGAGLTGLSTAYHFEKRGFFDYIMFEKDATVGGLCRSVYEKGFTFDYTGHLLHVNDAYLQTLIAELVGMEQLNVIHRRSYVFSESVYTKYPYQINLAGLPLKTIADCIQGFVTRKKSVKKNITFYDWVISNFGAGFAKHFFVPFQSKIWDYDIKKVAATWMGRFVPNTSLEQILQGITLNGLADADKKVGYNAEFLYPKSGGINSWIQCLANALKNKIVTETAVKTIDVKNKVIIFTNGHLEKYDTLITTMPLDILLHSLVGLSHIDFKKQAKNLVCNSVVNFNWGVARADLSDKHWIYFPEAQFPFYRIGFPHNFAHSMVPEGHSSLYGEFSYIKKSANFVEEKLAYARKQTSALLNIRPEEVVVEKIIHIPHAYVIYNFWREKNLENLLKSLQDLGIYSIGRYGEWKYSSMQEAVLDGKKIAEKMTVFPAIQAYYKYHQAPG